MDCPDEELSADSGFFDRLQATLQRRRIPISGSLELTYRCNLRCVHCYLGENRRSLADKPELGTAAVCGLLDQVVDAGCLWFTLTGGEPLLRRDFLQIYTYARQKGLLVTVFTNGTRLTARTADALAELPPLAVEITLYGHSQQTYERVTGVPGSYARCRHGIDLLLERGIKLKLKSMLMTLNRHELEAMQAFAAGLGVEYRYDPLLNAGLDGARAPLLLRLSPEEVVASDQSDARRQRDFQRLGDSFAGKAADDSRLYFCGAGKNSFHIDPYGQLSPCIMSRSHTFDLGSGSFKTAWEQFLPGVRSLPAVGKNSCAHCSLLALCGQCPGWAELESGDAQRPVEYLCKVAHLRAAALGLDNNSVK